MPKPLKVANTNRLPRIGTIDISRDLFGNWIVSGTEPKRARVRFVCRSEEEAQSVANCSLATDSCERPVRKRAALNPQGKHARADIACARRRIEAAADRVRACLVAYCTAKAGTQENFHGRSEQDLFAPTRQFEELVETFVPLLVPGDTLSDMRTRLVLTQSMRMADGTIREHHRESVSDAVQEIVPKALHQFLNCSVRGFFVKLPNGVAIADRLCDAGIAQIGELVGRSACEIAAIIGDSQLISELMQELKDVGLSSGLAVPFWQKARGIS